MRKLLIGLVVVVVAAAAGYVVYLRQQPLNTAAGVATSFLRRWQDRDFAGMASLVRDPPAGLAATYAQVDSDLGVSAITATAGALHQAGREATESASITLALKGLGPWTYPETVKLSERARRWLVDWTPAAIEPDLAAGERFTRVLTWSPRAPILGEGGVPLVSTGQGWSVGVEPARITSLTAVENAFNQYLSVPTSTVTTVLAQPGVQPTWFLPVVQITAAQFATVQPQLKPVPGILFEQSTARLSYAPGVALPVLGTVGPVTAQLLAQLGPPYATGDTVGLSGLELAYERQLAGTPAADIELKGVTGTVVGGSLKHFDGTAPVPVETTLDPTIQSAAEAAMAGVTQNAALVALDAATGQIRAVANRPAAGYDRALAGTYPPGSTMKIITTYALLTKGVTLTTPVTCPTSVVVDGKTFKNIEGEATGTIDLQQAFVESCNTAFVQLTETLTAGQLSAAAETFGFNAPEPLGLTSGGASFPPPKDIVDQAGASIGQAEVLASPVHMAAVAAAVASGAWHQPTLLSAAAATATVTPLAPGIVANLRTLMGLVVTQGTGTAAQLPGTPVSGKTGTAEFGNANPPMTHAWFIGFRGPLAFAVIVEGGGVGGKVAAPLAAKFLSMLPTS
jgi:cell division protein FtsI/penicillin-binding protein 2